MINIKMGNGQGSVYRLSGNRRKPYVAMITVKTVYDEEKDNYITKRKALGYFKTQTEARQCLAEYNVDKYDADMIGMSFGDIWKKILPDLEKELSKSRIDSFNSCYAYLKPIENMKVADIRTAHLQKVIDDCQKSSGTKGCVKTMMSKVFDYAMKNDLIKKDYSAYVTYQKEDSKIKRKLFDSEYICGLLEGSFKHEDAVTLILLYTGMRVRELLNNKVENLDLANRTLYIPKELAKNKSSVRYVPLHEDIIPLLEKFVSYGNQYITARNSKQKMCYQNYYEYLKKLGHTPHDARHTFVTRARECGIDAFVLQRIVGHSSKSITENVYTHLSNEELVAEISKINFKKK